MNHSEQRQNEARRQYNEAIVARHLRHLFRRLPMLSGFWLHSADAVQLMRGRTFARAVH